MKIAVSLLTCGFQDQTLRLMSSLWASDLMEYRPQLFALDTTPGPRGIVKPRIEIMRQILDARPMFDWCLELHSDMAVPTYWFGNLMRHVRDARSSFDVGIAHPAEMVGPYPGRAAIETASSGPRRGLPSVTGTRYCFPWLINLAAVRECGYYDADFHPGRIEDDDLVFRFEAAGWQTLCVPSSIVWHEGGGVRNRRPELIGWPQNEPIFEQKHGLTLADWKHKRREIPQP